MMTKGKVDYRGYHYNKGSGAGAGVAAIKGRSGGVCVNKEEIAKYWRRKKMEEEEHLFSAVKAAARIKSRTLTVSLKFNLQYRDRDFLNPIDLCTMCKGIR